ncbi:hypothetical protein M011DRAFT_444814 [Sporormia fimetaria CBS 119925]|uniref:N-acetyltransferase domain-containing protein n=1 Tax=Sporormia fimetaria CBS 119925 TaxID=1340428 RepID=A0A6A6V8Q7_9PLEO|nr:hypothetical protein M011DRAFT_444814 [Sporormia fimetaria CBS 119925]
MYDRHVFLLQLSFDTTFIMLDTTIIDAVITTPRLKLTRLTRADRDSEEFAWLHSLYSDEQASFWSLGGKTNSLDESAAKVKRVLSSNSQTSPSYQYFHLVHDIEDRNNPVFVGTMNLKAVENGGLILPAQLSLTGASEPGVLSLEVGYGFLPAVWGKGYATEALDGLLSACSKAKEALKPYTKLYVQAVVNHSNLASQRVVEKCGFTYLGDFVYEGEPVFIGGKWREKDTVQVWGWRSCE